MAIQRFFAWIWARLRGQPGTQTSYEGYDGSHWDSHTHADHDHGHDDGGDSGDSGGDSD